MNIPARFVHTLALTAGLTVPLSLKAQDKDPKPAPAPPAAAPAAAAPAAAAPAAAAPAESGVDPGAIAILNRAVDRLAAAKQFSVKAEVWQEVELENGLTVQGTKVVDIKVRRPDRLQVSVSTTVPKRSFFYDGKHFSLLDPEKKIYGTVEAPATLDDTLAKLEEEKGVALPIDDLLLSRPFGDGLSKSVLAQNLGVEPVLGVVCHHLVFQNEQVTWQAWVEASPTAVIRKVVIEALDPEDGPNLTAILTGWDFSTELPDFVFQFDSGDAVKTEFEISNEEAAPPAAPEAAEPAKK
ncbi:MAG: DUF2092 domain-containing protein [Verrucomicrobiota bacterium]